jgi:hypothetical protein
VGGDAGAHSLNRRPDYSNLDEDDVRVRPARSSRPRTRRRPAHEDAAEAFVAAVDRGRYGTLLDGRPVTAMRARELGRRSVAVGDRVALAGDVSGAPGTLARVVRIAPRTSVLRRSADDTDPVERVIVANADQLVIVTALAAPAAADRPVPGRRVRRRAEPAALPDQGRPRPGGADPGRVRAAGHSARGARPAADR